MSRCAFCWDVHRQRERWEQGSEFGDRAGKGRTGAGTEQRLGHGGVGRQAEDIGKRGTGTGWLDVGQLLTTYLTIPSTAGEKGLVAGPMRLRETQSR